MDVLLQNIDTLLIANRGEIACRIINSAKSIGLKTVAVYTAADATARHVSEADVSVLLNDNHTQNGTISGYLDSEQIIAAAQRTGAQAIHPGYGFLSENADFAQAVISAGLRFVGPAPETIRRLGQKIQAKNIAKALHIPILESHTIEANTANKPLPTLTDWPWLIKAAAGGGGRGMRIVDCAQELEQAITQAQAEAQQHFADASIFLEKYIPQARHIEVQVFGDNTGHVQHLWHRDCSVQRRYQKLIEEAPAAQLSEATSEAIIKAALTLARSEKYIGAGTVEFLVTPYEQWYFLEMNTRLQVEHPATEAISQEDLVLWQLLVADGQPLPPRRCSVPYGHAIEIRICAEDPAQQFMPSTGQIEKLEFPEAPDIRVDSALYEGLNIHTNFDSLLAKMIVWAPTRAAAIEKLKDALAKTTIQGITTNLSFHKQFIATEAFEQLKLHTNTLNYFQFDPMPFNDKTLGLLLGAATYIRAKCTKNLAKTPNTATEQPIWHQLSGWRHFDKPFFQHLCQFNQAYYRVQLSQSAQDCESFDVDLLSWHPEHKSSRIESVAFTTHESNGLLCQYIEEGLLKKLNIFWFNHHQSLSLQTQIGTLKIDPYEGHDQQSGTTQTGAMVSMMPGVVKAVLVSPKQEVSEGTPLFVIESMKIEQTIKAAYAGTVEEIFVAEGQAIETQQTLLSLPPLESHKESST